MPQAAVLQSHHVAKALLNHQLRGLVPKLGGQHTVERGGAAAALYMAQHGGAYLTVQQGLQLFAQRVADAAEAYGVRAVGQSPLHRELPALRFGPFADAYEGVALALLAGAAHIGDVLHVVVELGQHNHIGCTGQASMQGNPARIAAHGF